MNATVQARQTTRLVEQRLAAQEKAGRMTEVPLTLAATMMSESRKLSSERSRYLSSPALPIGHIRACKPQTPEIA